MTGSINVQATIIHRILKEQHQKNVTPPVIRESLHSDKTKVIKLINFLDDLLEKYGLAHSFASTFNANNTLSKTLNDYLFQGNIAPAESNENASIVNLETDEETQLRRITNHLTHALHFHIYQDSRTTGDHLPLIFYKENGIDYLYFALLSLADTITIDETTGNILDTTLIDGNALKVACKVNLTEMKIHATSTDPNFAPANYVAWVQRGSSEKIVEYIQNYIPVKYRIDDRNATTKLMKTLTAFLLDSSFDNNTREEINSEVIRLLRRKAKDKQPINIVEDIDPIIQSKANSTGVDLSESCFKTFREQKGYGETDTNASNIFSPASEPLNNFEKFDILIGIENTIKISGIQSVLRHKVKLLEDSNNPRLEISLTTEDVGKVKQVFENSNLYRSDESDESDTD